MSTCLSSNHLAMNQVHVPTAPSVGLLLVRVLYARSTRILYYQNDSKDDVSAVLNHKMIVKMIVKMIQDDNKDDTR